VTGIVCIIEFHATYKVTQVDIIHQKLKQYHQFCSSHPGLTKALQILAELETQDSRISEA